MKFLSVREVADILYQYIETSNELKVVAFLQECSMEKKLDLVDDQLDVLRQAIVDRFLPATKLLLILISFRASSKLQQYILTEVENIRELSLYHEIRKSCIQILCEFHTKMNRDRIMTSKYGFRTTLSDEWAGIVSRSRQIAWKYVHALDIPESKLTQCVGTNQPLSADIYNKRIDIRIFPTLRQFSHK